jgi:hypothetical protein
MDGFFNKQRCDRCGASLKGGFTMSRFSTDALCMKCAEEERQHPDYQFTNDIELAAVRAGDRNFAGLGWPGKNGRIKR